ncbi:MAG: MerR family transcriptional regulator [Chloroflexi bacterium]|nr:MerR family transcriptional regulator [Chloroflexota bacterium]
MSHLAFTIGEFAQSVGLNPKTIRYYEEIGLLPEPPRNRAGYRLYSNADLTRLHFVQRAKWLGLSLAEVKQLADYADHRQCDSLQEHLLALVQEKLAEVDCRLAELAALRNDLRCFQNELTVKTKETGTESNATAHDDPCKCLDPDQEKHHVN